jgi:Sec-independent protein secretion pathway component TatC
MCLLYEAGIWAAQLFGKKADVAEEAKQGGDA